MEQVLAQCGDAATLPCHAPPPDSVDGLEWTRTDLDQYVYLYRDGHPDLTEQHGTYRGRCGLAGGTAALVLENVTHAGVGTYECRFVKHDSGVVKRSIIDRDPVSVVRLRVMGSDGLEASAPLHVDISKCPIVYFGTNFTQLFASLRENRSLSLCFDSFSNSTGFRECVQAPLSTFENMTLEILSGKLNFSSFGIKREFPHINGSPRCALKVSMTQTSDLYLISFGPQTVLYFHSKRDTQNGDSVLQVWADGQVLLSRSAPPSGRYTIRADLSGCRDGGGRPYAVNQNQVDPAHCTVTTCGPMGALETSSTCRQGEVCAGYNRCVRGRSCSLVGPTVLDVGGAVGLVRGLCVRTLLNGAELQVLGSYSDRRLGDAPFLSAVILRDRAGRTITLGQGGAVEVEGQVHLNWTAARFQGVALWRDAGGITAVHVGEDNATTRVFYDGTLLHIGFSEGDGSRLHSGLCVDATSPDVGPDALPCDPLPPDPCGDGINCTSVRSSCASSLATLSCGEDVAPFIAACSELLCHYPSVDDLQCHFLHAYARVCHLQDWRETTGCTAPVCLNLPCGSREFCAVRPSGEAACFCRASFSQKYRTSSFSFGAPPVCDLGSSSITLFTCLLEEQGFDHRRLHLNDPKCRGVMDEENKTISFTFDRTNTCRGTIQNHGNQIVYNNVIKNDQNSDVTRENTLLLHFTCTYVLPEVRTATVKMTNGSSSVVDASDQFDYEIRMSLFADAVFDRPVTAGTELALRHRLWVRLEALGVGWASVALRIQRCWATSEAPPSSTDQHNLITDGCSDPAEKTVTIVSNGASLLSSFSFHVFRFSSRKNNDVFLHCQVQLCLKDSQCVPSCLGDQELR
ncbi:uncharacterized protein [Eucyclogobius newberryi]|uniref:uncharacterized protein n=1 Tax=Eucyclogobius newberryi TaxID=166745 RepID=UPI003B593C48